MTRRHMVWIPVSMLGLAVVGAQSPRTHDVRLAPETCTGATTTRG